MANTKISAMTAASTPLTGAELVPLDQSGGNVQTAVSNVPVSRTTEAAWTVPVVASFTALNSASWSNVANGVMTAPNASAGTWKPLVQAAPATPFDVYMRFTVNGINVASDQTGFLVRNSTNGRCVNWGFYQTGTYRLLSDRWTDLNTYGGAHAGFTDGVCLEQPTWFRLNITSTTITAYYSLDGYNWYSNGTETISTWLTASGGGTLDQVGFGVIEKNTVSMVVNSFSFTAPV